MKDMSTTLQALLDSDYLFGIPEYQRPYAWGNKQLMDLFSDLQFQQSSDGYFLGTILFEIDDHQKNKLWIIDGQQRMTSIVLLVRSIYIKFKQLEKYVSLESLDNRFFKSDSGYKFEINSIDNSFFQNFVLDKNHEQRELLKTPSQKRIYDACDFYDKILADKDLSFLKNMLLNIQGSRLLTYTVAKKTDAILIFETTNDRGKKLTNLEKLKSFLMYRSSLKGADEKVIQRINQTFGEIYRTLDDIYDLQVTDPGAPKIDEDSVLQYHFIGEFKWKTSKKSKDYTNYLEVMKSKIVDNFQMLNNEDFLNYINLFVIDLGRAYDLIKVIIKDKNPFMRDFFLLRRTNLFLPLLMKAFRLKNDISDVYKLCKLFEIFSFRVNGLLRSRTNTSQSFIYARARDFDGDFTKLYEEITFEIQKNCNNTRFEKILRSDTFYEEVPSLDQRYLFWKYENHLRQTDKKNKISDLNEADFLSESTTTKFSIEHIVPQNPRETKLLTEKLNISIDSKLFKEKYLHCLGNLTLDSQSSNSSKNNQSVDIKFKEYFRDSGFRAQHELLKYVDQALDQWTISSISKRRDDIVKFALNKWNLNQVSRTNSFDLNHISNLPLIESNVIDILK